MGIYNRRCIIIFVGLCAIFFILLNYSEKITLSSTFEQQTCLILNNSASITSRGILNERLAIVLAIDSSTNALDYALAINTTSCYAVYFGYPVVVLNLSNKTISRQCKQKDIFFKRHCAVHSWMEANKANIDYVLYIDADMGVINPCHTIQEYIDDKAHMIFYDRFYNFEIAAGSYLIKNSNFSRDFLKYWADYSFRLPKSFHGTDNGAVHQVFMEYNFQNTSEKLACYDLWKKSSNYKTLFAFQACTQWKLGLNNTKFAANKLKIIRKNEIGWVRDGWLTRTKWASQDFMFHGWKMTKLNSEWQWPFARKTFDMETCRKEPLLKNFLYDSKFVATNKVIAAELDAWRIKVLKKFMTSLKSIGLA